MPVARAFLSFDASVNLRPARNTAQKQTTSQLNFSQCGITDVESTRVRKDNLLNAFVRSY